MLHASTELHMHTYSTSTGGTGCSFLRGHLGLSYICELHLRLVLGASRRRKQRDDCIFSLTCQALLSGPGTGGLGWLRLGLASLTLLTRGFLAAMRLFKLFFDPLYLSGSGDDDS